MSFPEKYSSLFKEKCVLKHGDLIYMCGVYKITNIINGKFYIGSTSRSFKERFLNHFNCVLNDRYPKGTYLVRAFNKYGLENFDFDIIEITNTNVINNEQYYLDKLNPRYNIRKIAESNIGVKQKQTTKKKLSDINKRKINETDLINDYKNGAGSSRLAKLYKISMPRVVSIIKANNLPLRKSGITNRSIEVAKKHNDIVNYYKNGNSARACARFFKISLSSILNHLKREKIDTSKFDRKLTQEQIKKISDSLRGRKITKEHRKKLSISHKNLLVGGKNGRAKKVVDTSNGNVYDCIKYAAESIGITSSTLMDRIMARSNIKTTFRLLEQQTKEGSHAQ